MSVIGLVGFIGSGKDTAGDMLEKFGYKRVSFSKPLKDAVSIIFGWDRKKLEGTNREDRAWRELPDPYWSQVFGKPFTPRMALQKMGTEAGRNVFGEELWTASLIKRVQDEPGYNYVITDVRFNNEIAAINAIGGLNIRITRGPNPSYWSAALQWNLFDKCGLKNKIPQELIDNHQSEWDWIGNDQIDYVIDNNDTLQNLERQMTDIIRVWIDQ